MLIELIINAFYSFNNWLISLFDLQSIGSDGVNNVKSFIDSLFSYSSFLSLLFRIQTLIFCLPIIIAIVWVKYGYKITMWVVRKIPFVSMK